MIVEQSDDGDCERAPPPLGLTLFHWRFGVEATLGHEAPTLCTWGSMLQVLVDVLPDIEYLGPILNNYVLLETQPV